MNWNPVDYRIFETVSGSQMYGTSTPTSDTDYRGVCIPPNNVLLDPFHGFEQKDSGFEEDDRTIYALSKFIKLCADGNPNIIELLFAPESCWTFHTYEWWKLLESKKYFVSKKVKFTFSGYAISQLNAIKTHRQWFIDPPKKKPERKDFGLTDAPIISGEGLMNLAKIGLEYMKEEVQDEIRRELTYRAEKQKWDNYISWKINRNPKRMELEDKYGYDTKHAMHLFRLFFEGQELLMTGNITFPLKHAEELLAIRNGKYSYEEIIEDASRMDANFNLLYEESPLPFGPDLEKLRELYFYLIGE